MGICLWSSFAALESATMCEDLYKPNLNMYKNNFILSLYKYSFLPAGVDSNNPSTP